MSENLVNKIKSDPYLKQVAIMGFVAKSYNKVLVPRVNRLNEFFGLDTITKRDLMALTEAIKQSKEGLTDAIVSEVYTLFSTGEYTLTDLKETATKEKLYEVISPVIVANQSVLANNREFNKFQRDGSYMQILMENVKENLLKELQEVSPMQSVFNFHTVHTEEGTHKELIVLLGDLHIGALVYNTRTGGYNYEILRRRLEQYLVEIQKTAELHHVDKIVVVNVGDTIEHINMRNVNQSFESEFPATAQIAKGTRLVLSFLTEIEKLAQTEFYIIGGNHDRFQGNKADAIHNDNVAYIILDTLLLLQKLGNLQNTIIYDNRENVYYAEFSSCGRRIAVDHGDHLKGKGSNIPKFIKDYSIDLLITGHVHNHSVTQEDFQRLHIVNSSPMGANNYSKELKLPETTPSQTMIILENGVPTVDVKTVFLD